MTPFKVDCPECATSLRISNPDHVGKNAKCPKCRTWLTIPQPPEDEDEEVDDAPVLRRPSASAPSKSKPRPQPAPKPVEDEFDSDFSSDEFDDLPVESTPRKPAVKKKSKKRKSSSSFDGGVFAKIGGGAAVVLVVLFIGLKFARPFIKAGNVFGWFDRSSGIGPDLAWLPDGVDLAGEVRVADVLKAPALQSILQRPDSAMGLAMMSSMVGFGPSDIESVRFGLFASPMMGGTMDRFTVVVRLGRPAGVAALLENATQATPPTATKAAHGSRTIFTFPLLPQASLCCVDEQTILLGSNAEVRSVLDKEGRAESTSRFAFLDKARQLSVVVAPPNQSTASGFLGTASMAMFKNSSMTGM